MTTPMIAGKGSAGIDIVNPLLATSTAKFQASSPRLSGNPSPLRAPSCIAVRP